LSDFAFGGTISAAVSNVAGDADIPLKKKGGGELKITKEI